VLAQTVENFELAVLENCSEDGSREWLEELRDPRVRIYPASEPLSMRDNWARAVGVPKKEFVTFTGHDDLFDANYLETIGSLIGANPDAGLYHAHFRLIDADGGLLRSCRPMPARETDVQFAKSGFLFERDANGTGYVMRSGDFDSAGGFPPFHKMLYADHALWLSMVRGSLIATAPEECFSYRLHANSTSASSQWRDHLEAIKQFIAFVNGAKEWSDEMAQVIEAYAPGYFLTLCKNWYSNAVVVATKNDRRISSEVIDEFIAALEQIAPQEAERFKELPSIRLRHLINSYRLFRKSYNLYILRRYGNSELVDSR
jgi:glycosyltransferase involved in cell wall biosynthesis